MQHPHLWNSLHVQTSKTLARKVSIFICLLWLWKFMRQMVYLSKETLAVLGSVWKLLFLQHKEIAFPLLLQTASSGLLQYAVLKSAQNPSDSLVSRTHQEAPGSFVCRYLKVSWYAEVCQDIMLSSQLSHSPCSCTFLSTCTVCAISN